MWLPFFRLSLGEPNSVLTQKKPVGGTHLQGCSLWVVLNTKQTFFALSPCLLLTTGPFPPLSPVKKADLEKPFGPFPALFLLHSPGLYVAYHCAPWPPFTTPWSARKSPRCVAAFPIAWVGPSPSLTFAFRLPPSSLKDSSAACGATILALKEGPSRRNSQREDMIKWKGWR